MLGGNTAILESGGISEKKSSVFHQKREVQGGRTLRSVLKIKYMEASGLKRKAQNSIKVTERVQEKRVTPTRDRMKGGVKGKGLYKKRGEKHLQEVVKGCGGIEGFVF